MDRYITIKFAEKNTSARARLLMEEMPETCNAIVNKLPLQGLAVHAKFAGSEVALGISNSIKVPLENATSRVVTGDVAYCWLNGEDHNGLEDDAAGICWFYADDAMPRMHEGPVPVNIFARIEGDAEDFYKVSAGIHLTGAEAVEISLAD